MRRMNSIFQVTSVLVAASVLTMGCPFQAETFEETASGAGGGAGGEPNGNGGSGGSGGSPNCPVGTECVDPVPDGWTGYAWVRIVDAGEPSMKCPDGTDPAITFAELVGPANCSDCMCGTHGGASCSAPELTCFIGSEECDMASASEVHIFQPADESCIPFKVPGTPSSSCELAAAAVLVEGGCASSGGINMSEPSPWTSEVHTCATLLSGETCGADKVCASTPSTDYAMLCVQRSGSHECPLGWGMQIETFTAVNDMRGCSLCVCEVTGLECNGGGYRMHDGDDCLFDGLDPFDLDIESMACVVTSDYLDINHGSLVPSLATPSVASCTPTGGTPIGDIETIGDTTVCCR